MQIGEQWKSSSHISCYMECMLFYPDTCQSIVYNAATLNCRPGSAAFRSIPKVVTSIPEANSNDIILYAKQPVPPCNANGNFALYEICGTTFCLNLVDSSEEYNNARASCDQKNSRLFIADTMVRFSVFWHISREKMSFEADVWVGLNDIATEGTFVWDDGEPLSDEMNQYIWDDGQPNNNGNEDCAEVRQSDAGSKGLSDEKCDLKGYYFCEPL